MTASSFGLTVQQIARMKRELLLHGHPSQKFDLFAGDDLRAAALALPDIRMRSKKRKGKARVYLLWLNRVFHGEFPSNKARRQYLHATLTLLGHDCAR